MTFSIDSSVTNQFNTHYQYHRHQTVNCPQPFYTNTPVLHPANKSHYSAQTHEYLSTHLTAPSEPKISLLLPGNVPLSITSNRYKCHINAQTITAAAVMIKSIYGKYFCVLRKLDTIH